MNAFHLDRDGIYVKTGETMKQKPENQAKNAPADIQCPKNFQCLQSAAQDMCGDGEIIPGKLLQCICGCTDETCSYLEPYGPLNTCQCPLRIQLLEQKPDQS